MTAIASKTCRNGCRMAADYRSFCADCQRLQTVRKPHSGYHLPETCYSVITKLVVCRPLSDKRHPKAGPMTGVVLGFTSAAGRAAAARRLARLGYRTTCYSDVHAPLALMVGTKA